VRREGGRVLPRRILELARAYLFAEATGKPIRPADCEEVTAGTLGELRRVLRERVADEGPWWT
jgi:hypothetical protein